MPALPLPKNHALFIIPAKFKFEFRRQCPPGTPALPLPKNRALPSHVPAPPRQNGGPADREKLLHRAPAASRPLLERSKLHREREGQHLCQPVTSRESSPGCVHSTRPQVEASLLPARHGGPACPARRPGSARFGIPTDIHKELIYAIHREGTQHLCLPAGAFEMPDRRFATIHASTVGPHFKGSPLPSHNH